MRSNITLKEIAYLLDLSTSTISKALNDSAEISVKTKEKVKEMAREYNYRPNSIARNFKSSKSYTIGVIVPELSAPFFIDAMEGIMAESIKNDYKIMMYPSKGSCDKEESLTRMMTDGSIDGLIISMADETMYTKRYHYLKELSETNFPIVLLNNPINAMDCNSVFIDYENCGFMAVQKLTERKSNHILLLTDGSPSGKEWERGFQKGILKNNLSLQDNPIITLGMQEGVREKIETILSHYVDLDGIVVQNEKLMTLVEDIMVENNKDHIQLVNYVKNAKVIPRHIRENACYMTSDYLKLGEEATKLMLANIAKNTKAKTKKAIGTFFLSKDFEMAGIRDFTEKFTSMTYFKNDNSIPFMGTL